MESEWRRKRKARRRIIEKKLKYAEKGENCKRKEKKKRMKGLNIKAIVDKGQTRERNVIEVSEKKKRRRRNDKRRIREESKGRSK